MRALILGLVIVLGAEMGLLAGIVIVRSEAFEVVDQEIQQWWDERRGADGN